MPAPARDQDVGATGSGAGVDERPQRFHLLLVQLLPDNAVVDRDTAAHAHRRSQTVFLESGALLLRTPAEALNSDAHGLTAHLLERHFRIEVPPKTGLLHTSLARALGSGRGLCRC